MHDDGVFGPSLQSRSRQLRGQAIRLLCHRDGTTLLLRIRQQPNIDFTHQSGARRIGASSVGQYFSKQSQKVPALNDI